MQSGGLLARRKMNQPPYVVLVGGADDLEDLRNMAYAAANSIRGGSTEHWDEERSSGTAFYFMTWEPGGLLSRPIAPKLAFHSEASDRARAWRVSDASCKIAQRCREDDKEMANKIDRQNL
jgi:hypothetical protein